MSAVVTWNEDETARISSEEELRRLLARLGQAAAAAPFIAEVTLDNGDTLGIGLGRDRSLLSFVSGSGDPPYYLSTGPAGGDDQPLVFSYRGHWSEYPGFAAIPVDTAVDGLCAFLTTGRLPEQIDWTEG